MTQNALSPRETPNFFQLSLLRSAPGAIFRQESFWGAEEKTRGAKVFRGATQGGVRSRYFASVDGAGVKFGLAAGGDGLCAHLTSCAHLVSCASCIAHQPRSTAESRGKGRRGAKGGGSALPDSEEEPPGAPAPSTWLGARYMSGQEALPGREGEGRGSGGCSSSARSRQRSVRPSLAMGFGRQPALSAPP